MRSSPPAELPFQQDDNTPCYRDHNTTDWLEEFDSKFYILPWFPNSLDRYPIVLGICLNFFSPNVHQLKARMQPVCVELKMEDVRHLAEPAARRTMEQSSNLPCRVHIYYRNVVKFCSFMHKCVFSST